MGFFEHRKNIKEAMADNSVLIVYSGIPIHSNEDDYLNFEVNSQFFYLTNSQHPKQVLLMSKLNGETHESLFIEEADPLFERWNGKLPTTEDMAELTEMEEDDILMLSDFDWAIEMLFTRHQIDNVYFDTFRNGINDLPDYNLIKAKEFADKFPAVRLLDLRNLVAPFRAIKDAEEVEYVKEAVAITAKGLEEVLAKLKPGLMEYQVQAVFEGSCRYQGAKKFAFPTISGSGINGCSMHYEANDAQVEDGNLILLDLGAKYNNYCSDITRTYPANGSYSKRQRQIYDIVLKANRQIVETAKPGMTLRELNDVAKKVLAQGLMDIGLIDSPDQVGDYYMHGVSHSIGIDAHDVALGKCVLEPGWIISDEPGLYIDDEEIGIRIEDDLLITEDGCICLSEDIVRDPDEIEKLMKTGKR